MFINNSTILITGGTGSFGNKFTEIILREYCPKKVIIFSRDEYKQYIMQQKFIKWGNRLRFFIGDVRDKDRLMRAFDGVDIVIHAAALKQVPALEYNPIEAVKTNINGAINVIDAAINKGVKKVIALSTDKAVNPINLYGGTKLVSDKLFVAANVYSGTKHTSFTVVRYGNVAGSRGSVIPYFQSLAKNKEHLRITDIKMTRFWLSLEDAVNLVLTAIKKGKGGEVFVAKCFSFKIADLAKAIAPDAKVVEIGIRPGEKLHEVLLTEEDASRTYECKDCYVICPPIDFEKNNFNYLKKEKKVKYDFRYASNTNQMWLNQKSMQKLLKTIIFE